MPRRFASSYSWARVRSPLADARPEEERDEGFEEDLAVGFEDDRVDGFEEDLAEGFEEDRDEEDFADGLEEDLADGLDEPWADAFEEDREPGRLELSASPCSARSLFTVRAAISLARPFWPRFS